MRFLSVFLGLLMLSSPAMAAWQRAESKHFVIYSDGADKDLRRYAERLEAVHWLMTAAIGATEPAKIVKLRIYLVPDIDDVKRLAGAPGSDIAGFYRPGTAGAIAVVPRYTGTDGTFTGQLVLFHEYAHHFMLQYSPVAFPAWYVEGSAEIVSTASFERKGAISYGRAASHRQYEVAAASWIPIAKLIDGTYRDLPAEQRGAFYGQSWLLSHYLTFSDARKGQLRGFIAAINRGIAPADAAKVFGDLAQLQRELRGYHESGSFPFKAPALPAGLDVGTVISAVPAGEAALINERIEINRMTQPGKTEADKAARAAWMTALAAKVAKLGKDPDGLQLLADAQCEMKDWTACGATADALLAVAPTRSTAMLRKGEAMLRAKSPNYAVARDWIAKANRAAPDAPEPLIAYYESFFMEGRPAPTNALDGLVQAQQSVPQDSGTRLTLAQALIQAGRNEEARFILRPLANSPHDSGARQAAQTMLDDLDKKVS
jgi:Tetratricopeptide repeat